MPTKKNRRMLAISCNPAEQEAIELLMVRGGYENFTQFAKARLLGEAGEAEKRLKALEIAVDNLRQGYERHHTRWVETVKQVSGSDCEPLVGAVYALLHLMARAPDRAVMDKLVDIQLVEELIKGDDNGYRKT